MATTIRAPAGNHPGEVGLLGMIAIRFPGTRPEFDEEAMRFTNGDAANKLVDSNYRAPWNLVG